MIQVLLLTPESVGGAQDKRTGIEPALLCLDPGEGCFERAVGQVVDSRASAENGLEPCPRRDLTEGTKRQDLGLCLPAVGV